jgi:uncharacterized iron-regulated protein
MIPTFGQRGLVPIAAICLLLAACSTGPDMRAGSTANAPAAGRALDARTGELISQDEVVRRAIAARYVILGEVHDNAMHHLLQVEIFQAMLKAGRRPALAMEQLDLENQLSLDAARARGERDPERLADAGRFDRKGWPWPGYKPLVELAAASNLPLLAANLSREDARAVMKSGRAAPGVPPATPAERSALEQDIIDGHCGIRPAAALLSGMVEAQRARDARMAEVLERVTETGAVLIAGKGHARRDHGVPSHMQAALQEKLLSIGFEEVAPDGSVPQADYAGIYDLVWFTPGATREDPCRSFRLQ